MIIPVVLWALAAAALVLSVFAELRDLPTAGGRNRRADRLYLAAFVLVLLSVLFLPSGV